MADLTALATTANELLALFVAELQALGCELSTTVTTPDDVLAYVTPGTQIAWDTPGVVLNFNPIRPGQPGTPILANMLPSVVNSTIGFAVTLLRDAAIITDQGAISHTATIPPLTALQADGMRTAEDMGYMAQAAFNVKASYDAAPMGQGFVVVGVTPVGPDGGLMGVRVTLELSVQ